MRWSLLHVWASITSDTSVKIHDSITRIKGIARARIRGSASEHPHLELSSRMATQQSESYNALNAMHFQENEFIALSTAIVGGLEIDCSPGNVSRPLHCELYAKLDWRD